MGTKSTKRISPGEKLKSERTAREMTQVQLAKQLGFTNSVAICNWEHGGTPSYASAKALERVLGLPVELWGYDPVTCRLKRKAA